MIDSCRLYVIIYTILICTALCVYDSKNTYSADIQIKPTITLNAQYDDNVLFDDVDDYAILVIPEIGITYEMPSTLISLNGLLDIYKYLDFDEYDRENQLYTLDVAHEVSQNSEVGFITSYRIDYTFDEELEEIGVITQQERRKIFDVEPYMSVDISPRNTLSSSIHYSQTDHEDDEDRRDYSNYGVDIRFAHELNSLTDIFLECDYQIIDVDDESFLGFDTIGESFEYERYDQDQEIYQLLLGIDRQQWENIMLTIRSGVSLYQTEYTIREPLIDDTGGIVVKNTDIDEDDIGFVLDGTLSWRQERYLLRINGGRTLNQSVGGLVLTRDRLRLFLDYDLSDRFVLESRAGITNSELVSELGNVFEERDDVDSLSYRAGLSLNYLMSEQSSFQLGYTHVTVDDNVDDELFKRNQYFIQYVYEFNI